MLFCSLALMAQLDTPYGLDVGDDAPLIMAEDVATGNKIDLSKYLKKGPVLLVFYRGEWCKYCNIHLSEIEAWREELEASGIKIITVSPQTAENVKKTIDKTDASYAMISDTGFEIMEAYDVDFTVDQKTLNKYKLLNINIERANADDSNTLTVPATYLIGQDGKIIYAHFTEDYKERSSMEMVIEAYYESEAGKKDIQDLRSGSDDKKKKGR